jgi:predicted MFS family arabinose efflux permease
VFLLALIQFVHILDFVVLMPLGPALMRDYSLSPAQFATLVSSYNFAAAIMGILFGVIADRYDRKKLLFFFMTAFTIGTFLCSFSPNYEFLLTARIITGCFGGVTNAIVYAIISDIIVYERRGRAMGIISSAFSVASVIGVPLSLAISDLSHWKNSFIFIGSLSAIAITLMMLTLPSIDKHLACTQKDNLLKKYFGIVGNSQYWMSFVFIFLMSGSIFVLIPFLSPYAVKNMGVLETDLKYMYLVGGALTVVTARIFGILTDRLGAFQLVSILILISFGPILVYTHSGEISFVGYLILGSLFMSFVSGRMIPGMTLITNVPRAQDRGGFMSLIGSVRSFGSASLTTLGGLIVVENAQGKLINFNLSGYLAVGLGLILIVLAFLVNKYYCQK